MKILLLSNKSPWPPMDGGSAATMSMIKGLAAKGASVTVISFNTLKHHADEKSVPRSLAGFHFVNLDSGIKPFRLLLNLLFSTAPYSLTRFISPEFREKLIGLLNEKYDIVQIEGLAMAFYLPDIRAHSSARVIFRPHNIENNIWLQLADEETNIFKKLYFRITAMKTKRIESKVTDSFDAVAAMTGNDMEWFTKNGCRKPFIISSSAPDSEDIITAATIPMSVCFIGALDWRPNINGLRWLIKEVWPLVIKKLPDASLYIAGRNPGRKIKRICTGKNIIFEGEIESSSRFISDKSLLAVPLFSGSGIRMKILEGMSQGKCIVATPSAVAGVIIEDKKEVFIEKNAQCFADRITELLIDDKLRNETGINGRENVRKNYDIFVSAEELMKLYTRLA